jgi:RNA polymerase sigma-70 factor (ECF subfamily)
MHENLQQVLGRLPETSRVALILRDLEGFSYEEVAEVLDASVASVKLGTLQGRRALCEILEPVFTTP